MAPPTGPEASSISVTAPNTPPAPSPSPSLRQLESAQERIDNILDAARRRSLALKRPQPAISMSLSPNQRESLYHSERDNRPGEVESSEDEQTAIVRRDGSRPQPNYQSTDTSGVRARSSNASVRRPAQERAAPAPVVEEERDGEVHDESWWQRQLAKYGSIELENKASVARDHLALERTYLAWLRTSLAFASIGIAITQLFRLNTAASDTNANGSYKKLRQMGKPLGATFLGISIVVLFLGFHRYFESQHWIIKGKFPASRGSVALITAIAFALMVTSLAVVLIVEPSAYET